MADEFEKSRNERIDAATDEVIGILGAAAKNSEKLDEAVRKAGKLIRDAASTLDDATDVMQKTMTFETKTFADSFKSMKNSYAEAKQAAIDQLKGDIEANAEVLQKLQDTNEALSKEIDKVNADLKQLGDSAEDAAKKQDLENKKRNLELKQQKNNSKAAEVEIHKKRLESIDTESAYKIKVQKDLKKTALNLISSAANSIVKVFQDSLSSGWSKLSSTWEQVYGVSTSYNSYSKSDYDKIVNDMQAFIKQYGLSESTNITEYQEKFVDILKGGLTGELASTVAKYAIVSDKGGITFDFADPDFLKSIKAIADTEGIDEAEAYLQQVTVQSKAVIGEVGDSFGFANNQINTMIASLNNLRASTGMTVDALEDSATHMTALNGVLGKTNVDTSKIYSVIADYAQTGLKTNSAEALLSLSGIDGKDFRTKVQTEGVGSIIDSLMKGFYEKYGDTVNYNQSELLNSLNSALGGTLTTDELTGLISTYESYDEFKAAYDKALNAANNASFDEYVEELPNYVTEQEKLTNEVINGMTDTLQVSKNSLMMEVAINAGIEKISNLLLFGNNGVLGGLVNVGSKLWGYLKDRKLNVNVPTSGSGGTPLLPDGSNNPSGGSSSMSSITKYFTNGAGKGGKILSSTGVRVGGAIGGGAMLINDAVQGYKDGGIGGAIKGGLTGVTEDVTSIGQIVGNTAKNAGKWALIGNSILPGIGAAVGGVLGGVTSLIASVNDYNDTTKASKRTAEALSDIISRTQEAYSKFNNNMQIYTDDQAKYDSILQGSTEHLDYFKEKFPSLNSLLGKNNELTDEYVKLLKYKLDAEKKDILKEYGQDLVDSLDNVNAHDLKFSGDNIDGNAEAIDRYQQFSNFVKANKDSIDSVSFDNETQTIRLLDKNLKPIEGTPTLTFNDLAKVSDIDMSSDTGLTDSRQFLGDSGLFKDNTIIRSGSHWSTYSGTTEGKNKQKDLENQTPLSDDEITTLLGYWDTVKSLGENWNELGINELSSDEGEYLRTWYIKNLLKDGEDENGAGLDEYEKYNNMLYYIKKSFGSGDNGKNYAGIFGDNGLFENEKEFEKYVNDNMINPTTLLNLRNRKGKKGYDGSGSWTPAFKTGLNYVPYDNYLALLHKGERVQTAADVQLEKLSSEYSSNRNSMASELKDTLVEQTDTIIQILTNIYNKLSGTSSPSLSDNVVYSGASLA